MSDQARTRSGLGLANERVFVRIGRTAAAEENQRCGSRVFDAMWTFWWNTDRIASCHNEVITCEIHHSITLSDVVELFGYPMGMHEGFDPDRNSRFGQALV